MTDERQPTLDDRFALVLAFVDKVIRNSRELQGGRLLLVNREDVEDLARARDLVRAELRSRAS